MDNDKSIKVTISPNITLCLFILRYIKNQFFKCPSAFLSSSSSSFYSSSSSSSSSSLPTSSTKNPQPPHTRLRQPRQPRQPNIWTTLTGRNSGRSPPAGGADRYTVPWSGGGGPRRRPALSALCLKEDAGAEAVDLVHDATGQVFADRRGEGIGRGAL